MPNRARTPQPSAAEPISDTDGFSFARWAAGIPEMRLARGTLYLVSVPIGNVDDISIRALRVLKSVSVIAAENPSVTRAMLRNWCIETPVCGFRSRTGDATTAILTRLQSGDPIALVCDAGTPLVADAGGTLARTALAAGIALVAVPGPSAALAALVVSGCAQDQFTFYGFAPRRKADRYAFFASLAGEARTILLYESRAYLRDTLRRLLDSLGPERRILVARDLTRSSETCFSGALSEAVVSFREPPAGEFTLVICGSAFSTSHSDPVRRFP